MAGVSTRADTLSFHTDVTGGETRKRDAGRPIPSTASRKTTRTSRPPSPRRSTLRTAAHRPEPTQVIRKHAINALTIAMNRAYWALPEIQGVWAHYMLAATPWPMVPQPISLDNDRRHFPGGRIEPGTRADLCQTDADGRNPWQKLGNTAMETYAQASPSSRMTRHNAVSNMRGRDFVGFPPEEAVKVR